MEMLLQDLSGAKALRVTGRLDAETASDFDALCHEALADGNTKVLLDLTGLDFLSSAGLRRILDLGKQIHAAAGRFVLAARPGPVRQLLQQAGLAAMFPVLDTFELARAQVFSEPQFRTSDSGKVKVISALGRIDAERLAEFQTLYTTLLQEGAVHMVLDFSKLAYLSSAGLSGILNLGKQLRARHGKLALLVPAGPIRKVMELSGFTQMFSITDTLQEAVWNAQ